VQTPGRPARAREAGSRPAAAAGLDGGNDRQRVVLVVPGVPTLCAGGVGRREHRVGVRECRLSVLPAALRIVVGGRGVKVRAGQRESLCGGVDLARVGHRLSEAAGVVIADGPRVDGGGVGHCCSLQCVGVSSVGGKAKPGPLCARPPPGVVEVLLVGGAVAIASSCQMAARWRVSRSAV